MIISSFWNSQLVVTNSEEHLRLLYSSSKEVWYGPLIFNLEVTGFAVPIVTTKVYTVNGKPIKQLSKHKDLGYCICPVTSTGQTTTWQSLLRQIRSWALCGEQLGSTSTVNCIEAKKHFIHLLYQITINVLLTNMETKANQRHKYIRILMQRRVNNYASSYESRLLAYYH